MKQKATEIMEQKATNFIIEGYRIVFADGAVVQILEGDVIEVSRLGRKPETGRLIRTDGMPNSSKIICLDSSEKYYSNVMLIEVDDITGIKVIERGRYGKQA